MAPSTLSSRRDRAKSVLFIALWMALLGSVARAETCAEATEDVTIDDAYKVFPRDTKTQQSAVVDPAKPPPPPPDPRAVQLGNVIAVKITNLEKLYSKPCEGKTLVLFLNGYPIKSLTAFPPDDPKHDGQLQFVLTTKTSPTSWARILGRPDVAPRKMEVSVGFEDQFPLRATGGGDKPLPVLHLDIIENVWFVLWIAFFAVMVVVFFYCALRTNILRDGNPTDGSGQAIGTYSLSKAQGAWWFFVIVASYLLIGIVAGDFVSSLNSTALILLGIGAGTVLGSAAIDASKSTPEAREAERSQANATRDRLSAIDTRLKEIDTDLADPSKSAEHPTLRAEKAALTAEQADKKSLYRKLTKQSENFIVDILSDANGINFHRFQMAVWTLVLSIVFIKDVYENLAMPIFDTTLMGLLGLSAGTYLGLKIPEPTVSK